MADTTYTLERRARRIVEMCRKQDDGVYHSAAYVASFVTEHLRAVEAETTERCAKVAEDIWDYNRQGAHGGEQANRTAAAIRALQDEQDKP